LIAVIADDLSGAAELAGVAAQQGFRAEVQTVFDPETDAEVVAVDTDTRWRPAAEAARIVAEVTTAVLTTRPAWVFKKTDSVLRGNVRAEIEAILDVTGQRRALLIPANPSKARVIRGGVYFINGVPLAQSAFARDPEYPRWTSDVAELLAPASPQDRLLVPDAACAQDVETRAAEVDADILPAGGVDFFEAILKAKCGTKASGPRCDSAVISLAGPGPTLFVCGSAAAWDSGRAAECTEYGIPVFPMPDQIFNGEIIAVAMDKWCAAASTALRDHGRAMLTIGRQSIDRSTLSTRQLSDRLVEAAAGVLATQRVERLCLEGGATAAALLRRFGWTRMTALPTELPGVAALKVAGGPALLIKPGSYRWPQAVLVAKCDSFKP
jgi:uncharacterized protein YgbK (DUF1537 family)